MRYPYPPFFAAARRPVVLAPRRTPHWLLGLLLLCLWPTVARAVTLSSGSTAYTTSASNLTIDVSGTYTGDITVNRANCVVNFSGLSYPGQLTVNGMGTGCVINVGAGATITGSSNSIGLAATITNNGTWTGNFYTGVASGTILNNAGVWGGSGVQFSPLSGITINNTGTWNAVAYGVSGGTVTITNGGTWLKELGNITTTLTLTNTTSGTWSQPLSGGSGASLNLTNNGTWASSLVFGTGTNAFRNRAGATATFSAVTFGGTTTVTNGVNGGTPTLTFSGALAPTATTTITNFAGTVTTAAALSNAGTLDNRATWLATTFASTGTVVNAPGATLTPSVRYTTTAGTTTNNGTLNLATPGAEYVSAGGTTTNNGTLTAAANFSAYGGTVTNNVGATITTPIYENRSFFGPAATVNDGTVACATSCANTSGTFTNNAGATVTTPLYTNSAGTTTNSGTLDPTGDFVVAAGASSSVIVNSSISPGGRYLNGGTTTNNGTISPATYYDNVNSAAVTTNNGLLAAGTYYVNGGTTTNNGDLTTGTYFEAQSSGVVTNAEGATLTASTDFSNAGVLNNAGALTLPAPTGLFRNFSSGSVTNAGGLLVAGDFTNNGTFNGAPTAPTGAVRVSGVSTNTFSTFGASGLLDFCDLTPGTGPLADKGFNVQTGTVRAAVTTCSVTLPVVLTTFGATAAPGRVVLHWATASEANSATFTVERSPDGRTFAPIATVAAQGYSSRPVAYTATDPQPLPALAYYRLRQTDRDGTTALSAVVVVPAAPVATGTAQLWPNPVLARAHLDLSAWPVGAVQVEVVSLDGRRRLATTYPGGQLVSFDLGALPAGAYLVRIYGAAPGAPTVVRLLKQ